MKKQDKQKKFRVILLLGLIGLLLLTVSNSIYVNPGDSIVYEIDNPLESYTFDDTHGYNVSRITIAPTYIVFNNTGFNITSVATIQIEIFHIDEDILNPADTNDILLNFTVGNPASDTWFNISGFKPTSTYNVYTDISGTPPTLLDTVIANSTGSISFFDIPSWNEAYVVYLSEDYSNTAPVISNPYPSNGSVGVSAVGSPINIYATDAEGELMKTDVWTNASGSWIQVAGWDVYSLDFYNWSRRFALDDGFWNFQDALLYIVNEGNQSNGTRYFAYNMDSDDNISVTQDWGMTSSDVTYYWSVNCTDNGNWTNRTYHFTTSINYPPNITQPYPADGATDISVAYGTAINANITDDDGDTMDVSIWSNFTGSWTQITYPEGESTSNYYFMDDFNNDGIWNYTDYSYWNSHKTSQDNGTYGFYENNTVTDNWGMDTPNTKYWWQVRADDGNDTKIETFNFTTGNAPNIIVETYDASSVEETNCRLNGMITYNELGLDCNVRFQYWRYGSSTIYETVNQSGYQADVPFWKDITLPIAGTVFQYRAVANNGFGDFYGENVTFVSKPYALHNIAITYITGGFTISWDDPIAGNLNNSILVFNNDHIPTSRTDGTVIYNESMSGFSDSYNHVGLTSGLTYYYSAWAMSSYYPIYQYSDSYISASSYFLTSPTVITGDVTGVFETNCTLHGSLVDDGGGNCTVWFEYGTTLDYGNDTRYNISYNFINTTISVDTSKYPTLQFNSDYWIQNDTIGADTDIGIFLNTSGLWDNVTFVFRYNGEITSWWKIRVENELSDITSYGRYLFVITNDTVPFILSWDNQINRTTGYNLKSHFYTRPGQLYHYRACANNSRATTYGDNVTFLSKPKSTIRFPGGPNPWIHINGTYSPSALNLTWIKGMGANNTYIERNTISSWSRGSGTVVYNDTGTYFNDTGLSWNTLYYYQAWGFANWTYNGTTYWQYSSDYSSNSNTTQSVEPPYNGSGTYDVVLQAVNLTWNRGNNSDREVVTRSNTTYPTSPTDGYIVQNSTDQYYQTVLTSSAYFTVWSYNETINMFSSTGLNIPWGVLGVNVFNESHPEYAVKNWDIEISNAEGTETYVSTDNNNPLFLNYNDIPYGEETFILVSCDNFYQRSIYMDLLSNNFYNITMWIPQVITEPPGGGGGDPVPPPDDTSDCTLRYFTDSTTITNPGVDNTINFTYYLDEMDKVEVFNETDGGNYWVMIPADKYNYTSTEVVVDETALSPESKMLRCTYYYWDCEGTESRLYFIQIVNQINQPIQDADVTVRKYINTTGRYENLSILHTDGYGYASLWLIPNSNIKLFVSADGYESAISEWIPDPVYYGLSYPKIIQLASTPAEPVPAIIYPTFTGTRDSNYINLTYYDENGNTTDTQLYVYERNLSTSAVILYYTHYTNNTNSFTVSFAINSTNTYECILFYNHTIVGGTTSLFIIFDGDYHQMSANLETLLRNLIGDNPFGWLNFLIFLFLVIGMMYADKKDAGKVMLLLGGIFLFLNVVLGLQSTLFTVAGGMIPALFMLVGVLIMWTDSRKEGD